MKNVLVTGSSTGFGLLITKRLLEKGYTVFATMRNLSEGNAAKAEKLNQFAEDKSGKLHLLDLDVTDQSSVQAAVAKAVELEGPVDVLVNNAGVGQGGHTEAFDDAQFKKVFEVNVFGVQRMIRAVMPSMRQRNQGLVINVSSVMGRMIIPFAGIYTASKFALEGLSESYRYELTGTGVDMVVVEPGGFATNFMDNMMMPAETDRVESYGELAEAPGKLWGGMTQMLQSPNAPDPNEVAKAVIELIETPAEKRPTRTVVDPMTGGEAPKIINETTDKVQAQVMQSLGMGQQESV